MGDTAVPLVASEGAGAAQAAPGHEPPLTTSRPRPRAAPGRPTGSDSVPRGPAIPAPSGGLRMQNGGMGVALCPLYSTARLPLGMDGAGQGRRVSDRVRWDEAGRGLCAHHGWMERKGL